MRRTGSPRSGTASVVAGADADYAPIESALIARYGFQFSLFRAVAKIRKGIRLSEDLAVSSSRSTETGVEFLEGYSLGT